MDRWSVQERGSALREMASRDLDLLVVGGGITGAGVALDAAARGFRTGLVEAGDFASGTSSKSTKLIHGGLRYLPQLDFHLVREALAERRRLLANAPHLVHPLRFVVPVYSGLSRPLGIPFPLPHGIGARLAIREGLLLYELLSRDHCLPRHERFSASETIELVPGLKRNGLRGAFTYYDAETDDSLLTLNVLQTATSHGALAANYAEVTGFESSSGTITGAVIRDRESGGEFAVRARQVVNATGAFAADVSRLAGTATSVHITPARGAHLTLPGELVPIGRDAVVIPQTDDTRVMFAVPWGSRVIAGTTDSPGGDVRHPIATKEDVEFIIRHLNRYLGCRLTENDIISAWAGYRPLVSAGSARRSSRLSRSHVVLEGPGGLITVTGGKLTIYRKMAEDAVDAACRRSGTPIRHVTEDLPLAGATGEGADGYLGRYGSGARDIQSIVAQDPNLGRRVLPDLPCIMAEVVYACRKMMAVRLEDVLVRRLHVAEQDPQHGLLIAPDVARVMGKELGWSDQDVDKQVQAYREVIGSGEFG